MHAGRGLFAHSENGLEALGRAYEGIFLEEVDAPSYPGPAIGTRLFMYGENMSKAGRDDLCKCHQGIREISSDAFVRLFETKGSLASFYAVILGCYMTT